MYTARALCMGKTMRCLDLFSGCGGMGRLLPVDTVAYCEKDPFPKSILKQRMKTGDLTKCPIHDDIKTLVPPACDIIIGGFPCQDIAFQGIQRGFGGKRSSLYHEIMRVADVSHPEYIFLENVRNILRMPLVWQTVLQTLHDRGYDASWCVVSANQAGAPHRRDRWFCMARKRKDTGGSKVNFGDTTRMPTFGDMKSGRVAAYKDPKLPKYFFKTPKVLRKLDGVPCTGKIRQKDKVIRLWGTPTCRGTTCHNLTQRQSSEYTSQIKFELGTRLRTKYVNLAFTEWVMGLPLGWTDPRSDGGSAHPGFEKEPCARMVSKIPDHYHKRAKVLGNMCVSQQAKLAWDVLMPRL